MHYYKKNIGDYAKKAGRLTMLQHGAYTLLLDACYDREVFPTLEDAIEWTWASTKEETEAVEFVLKKFFTLEDGRYVQNRIKEELEKFHENSETNKRIAIEREAKRKEKNTNRAQVVNEAPPNHKPITNNQEEAASQPAPASKKTTLATYIANCKAAGKKPIPDDHYVREYAKDAGIVDEMLQVNWEAFKSRYLNEKKLYIDWPKVFATSVKERWFKLWFPSDDGMAAWTSTGIQEKQVLEKRMKGGK